MKKIFTLLVLASNLCVGTLFSQPSGYPVEEYLSQINISDIAISPNGQYIAIVSASDDFKTNKKITKLWQYEIDNEGAVVSKTEIPIYKGRVSQLQWTKDSDYLVFKSKNSTGNSLFKVATKNPKVITPVIKETEKLKNVSAYKILDDNTLLFYEKFSVAQTKKDTIAIKYPQPKEREHTTFKKLTFGSNTIDSLFTIEANVAYFEVSPDHQKIIYSNYEPSGYYSNKLYQDSKTFIIDSKNGSPLLQLTDDMIWDDSWWSSDESSIYTLYSGDTASSYYNMKYDELYRVSTDRNKKDKLLKSFDGRIRSAHEWKDQNIIVNGDQSTSSHFFKLENNTLKKLTDFKGTISNFVINRSKNLIAFSLVRNDRFEEVYIARSLEELNNPIKISDFNKILSSYDAPEIEKVSWKNSEGNTIEGVLMWPPGKKGATYLPFVVDIHGGPWSGRSEAITLNGLQYYYFASLLASKGFLVLLPNYSGGSSRGKTFLDALNGAPRTRPTDDIITGVEYLIDQQWVDKNKMVVKGASYGGLLTNSIIGETTLFKAALTSCGIWDETAAYGTNDGDISIFIRFENVKFWENPELFRKESALYNANKIKTPTLITHGEKDVRVPTSQSYAMYYALKELGVPVEMIIYKGEGHLYQKPASKLAKVKAELEFINKYIKF